MNYVSTCIGVLHLIKRIQKFMTDIIKTNFKISF